MKALQFFQQLEIRLEIKGEEFHQGQTIPCQLTINNRGTQSSNFGVPFLTLCQGEHKKIKQKSEDAFSELEAATFPELGDVAPGETKSLEHSFELSEDSPISDRTQSLYLLFGIANTEANQHLQLRVLPHEQVESIIGVFESSFQFDLKSTKFQKGKVVAKLQAPSGSRYSALESVDLSLAYRKGRMDLLYTFRVRNLAADQDSLTIKRGKSTFKQTLEASDYLAPGNYVESAKVEPLIREALSGVTSSFA